MKWVIDASVALKWFIRESESQTASARHLLKEGNVRISSELIVAEVSNTVWKKLNQGLITAKQAEEIVNIFPRFFTELIPLSRTYPNAWRLACELNYPVYDCFYVAIAIDHGSPLVTADQRLLDKLSGTKYEKYGRQLESMP